jgi:hypothetical protein
VDSAVNIEWPKGRKSPYDAEKRNLVFALTVFVDMLIVVKRYLYLSSFPNNILCVIFEIPTHFS